MSLPKYPEYRDSGIAWLGETPGKWIVERFDACTSTHRTAVTPKELGGQVVLHYSIPSVQATGGATVEDGSTIDSNKLVIGLSQLLVSKLNPHKQVVVFAKPHPELLTVASTEFVPLVPTKAHSKYIQYIWQSPTCLNYLLARCDSATRSHQRVSPDDISKMQWSWPSSEEQSAIAAFLDHETAKIDALIAEQEKLIALLAEKRQATISYAVTKGLNPNAPMKDSGIPWLGEVPAHWPIAKLSLYASVENGTTPSRAIAEYWEGGDIPWLASGEVNQFQITEAAEFITEKALEKCSLRILPVGTVVVGMVGQGKTRGMSAILGIPAAINQNLAAICPGAFIESTYILNLLHAVYEWLREAGRGGNQAAMNCEILSALKIPVPSLIEQRIIVGFIENETGRIDLLRVEAERGITLLKERRAALIAAAVTGRIDVRSQIESIAI